MAPKRAAGDGATPPPGKRMRATEAAPGRSNPEPSSPTPGKRFRAIVLVVLFFKRPKSRSTDSVPVSLERIGRMEIELGRLRLGLGQVCDTLGALLREQEHTKNLFHALASRLQDNIIGPSPNHHNHERPTRQGTNQEENNAKAEGLAATESEGKDTSIRLRFLSEMKPPVYHDDEIKSIRIGIFDGDTMIKSGAHSKVKVEVLALEGSFPYDAQGSWTPKEFHEHVAYGRDGKGNVLAGKGTNAQLINGECHLGSIRFREGSCRARNGKFIIGARVCDGQAIGGRVQEAVMSPVVVQDRRNKYNEKSHPPNLNDAVYRLEKIAINGKYRERLASKNISTVEHFLKALNKDEDNLAKILQIKKKCKDWDKMVEHAQECCLEGKPELKSYRCEEKNVVLFFNYVHRLVGAKFGSRYIASDMFEPAQQNLVDKLKLHAHDQLDGLTEDNIMKDNIPVPIDMDTGAVAGPSCMPSASQQEISDHQFAVHQVVGTPATEVLSPHVPTEPLRVNANNAPSLDSSISDPYSAHSYQACNTQILQNVNSFGGIPAVEGLTHGQRLNEPPFAIANNGSRPGFSVPDQDQGTRLTFQEQHFSDYHNDLCLDSLGAQAFYFGAIDATGMMRLFVTPDDDESPFLQNQADTNYYVEQPILLGPGNDTSEAHTSMAFARHQLSNTGAPGSAQGSVQVQTQAPLANINDGAAGSSESAQQAHPPQQWS